MALQMIRSLRPAVERIRQHDRELAAQLKRAGSSVPGNIAEGARRVGQDRLHHYRVAAGSAGESVRTWRSPWPGVMWTKHGHASTGSA